jgi:uroporphyrinogen-III synthase
VGDPSRALTGKRIVVTRSAGECEPLSAMLRARQAVPVIFPLIEFARPEDCVSLDAALAEIYRFDWVLFTSGQAVKAVSERLAGIDVPIGSKSLSEIRCAAVGPGTAQIARQAGFRVNYVAERHTGVSLARELGLRVKNCNVLLPRSDRANPDLPAALKQQGGMVTEVVAYRTVRPQKLNQSVLTAILSGETDAILFYSPSAVHHFEELVGRLRFQMLPETTAIAAVGPVTAAALRNTGVERIEVAADTTDAAVIEVLERHFVVRMNPAPAGAKRA